MKRLFAIITLFLGFNLHAQTVPTPADLPTCNNMKDGDVYHFSNAAIEAAVCDNTVGRWFALIDGKKWEIASLADWTELNTTSPATTVTDINGGILFSHPNNVNAQGAWQLYGKDLPGTVYSMTAVFAHLSAAGSGLNHAYAGAGVGNASGEFRAIAFTGVDGTFRDYAQTYSGPSGPITFIASSPRVMTQVVPPSLSGAALTYYCVWSDGADQFFAASKDAVTWDLIAQPTVASGPSATSFVIGNNSDNAGVQDTVFLGFAFRSTTDCGPVQ